MDTELTPEQLANLIQYWVENSTNYQKRLKPIMTPDECTALAQYLIQNRNTIIQRPPTAASCPHKNIEATQDLHWVKCTDCGKEWYDVQG